VPRITLDSVLALGTNVERAIAFIHGGDAHLA
jgi:hypothetical protein